MIKSFYLALSFLTRIPTPDFAVAKEIEIARSVLFYPLVGLIIGLALMLPCLFLSSSADLMTAAIATTIWAALTGGLHLDGVGDSADAWLGGTDDEKTHRILKDPVVGSAGVIAMTAVMLLKFAAISTLLNAGNLWPILFAPVFSRALVLFLFIHTDYVREDGIGSLLAKQFPSNLALPLIIFCALIATWISITGLVVMLIAYWLLRRLMIKRLNGFTGDTAGACIEYGEVFWLIGVVLSL